MNRANTKQIIVLGLGVVLGVGLARWVLGPNKGDVSRTDSNGTSALMRPSLIELSQINETLPPGFRATVYARDIPYPTTLAVDTQGNVYVGSLEEDNQGNVYVYSDRDEDGLLDKRALFWGPSTPITGILLRQQDVYVASRGKISVLRDRNGDYVADSVRVIIDDLPHSKQQPIHANNGLAYGPDGWLYFGMGASCNACLEPNSLRATVLRCNPRGGACKVFARGLRNVYDVAFHPLDGTLFGADNGSDAIGGASLDVEDEINLIVEDGEYGWPFCWGKQRGLECGNALPALAELQPHAAPAGLTFYTGSSFPRGYRNNLFVALWGDTGRSVVRVILSPREEGYSARISDFVRLDRPVDVITGPDGSLLIADTDTGRIYRITYDGS